MFIEFLVRVALIQRSAKNQRANFLIEGCRCGLDMRKPRMDSTKVYIPFGALIERPQMCPYLKKLNLSSEGCRYNAQQKCRRWVVLECTSH